jgi:hypothetical protein
VVADDQLSLAIGKGGQNARLAAKLTGWRIDLISRSEDIKRSSAEKAARIDIETVELLGPRYKEALVQAGIESVQELLALDRDRLLAIPGVSEKTADGALAVARWTLARHQAETAATEVHITPEMEKDEAAQAVASIEHPEAAAESGAAAQAALDAGPPPEAVELEEQFDPDVVPSHLGTPVASDEATGASEERKEETE